MSSVALLQLLTCGLLAGATPDVCLAPDCTGSGPTTQSFDLLRADYPQELQEWIAADYQQPERTDPSGATTSAHQDTMRFGELSAMQGDDSQDLEKAEDTIAQGCVDTNGGAKNKLGFDCSWFNIHKGYCGAGTDSDFDSYTMCCACGGGHGATPRPTPRPPPAGVVMKVCYPCGKGGTTSGTYKDNDEVRDCAGLLAYINGKNVSKASCLDFTKKSFRSGKCECDQAVTTTVVEVTPAATPAPTKPSKMEPCHPCGVGGTTSGKYKDGDQEHSCATLLGFVDGKVMPSNMCATVWTAKFHGGFCSCDHQGPTPAAEVSHTSSEPVASPMPPRPTAAPTKANPTRSPTPSPTLSPTRAPTPAPTEPTPPCYPCGEGGSSSGTYQAGGKDQDCQSLLDVVDGGLTTVAMCLDFTKKNFRGKCTCDQANPSRSPTPSPTRSPTRAPTPAPTEPTPPCYLCGEGGSSSGTYGAGAKDQDCQSLLDIVDGGLTTVANCLEMTKKFFQVKCTCDQANPSRSPTPVPTSSPTVAPAPTPSVAPTAAPIKAPTPSTTKASTPLAPLWPTAEASAMDDPHITNLRKDTFDIKQPGQFSLLQVPLGVSQRPLLRLDAEMHASGDVPCGLFIKMVILSGRWLTGRVVRIRPAGGTPGGTVAGKIAQLPFAMQVASSEALVDGLRWASFGDSDIEDSLAEASTRMVRMLAVRREELGPFSEGQAFRFELGGAQPPAIITVSQGSHQALNVALARMGSLGHARLGGLLGTEPHDRALEAPTEECQEQRAPGKGEPMLLGRLDEAPHVSASSLAQRADGQGSLMRAAWD